MTPSQDDLKRAAARRAVEYVASGTTIGLGSGSTVRPLLEFLAERLASGALRGVLAVPTSEDTAARCRALGIPLTTLDEHPHLELAIDGADEIGPRLDLIKGLGGALLREKLVVGAARRFVVVADASKRVRKLGTRAPVPVEVVPFGWTTQLSWLDHMGAESVLRLAANGSPFVSDGGHYVIDCHFKDGIAEPGRVQREVRQHPGVVECGLFLGMADAVVIGGVDGPRVVHADVEPR